MTGVLRTGVHLLVVVLQVAVLIGLAPLVAGITRQVRARLEGRAGAGLLQPWRDVRKLLGKRPMHAAGTSVVTRVAPMVLLASGLMVAALVPLVSANPLPPCPMTCSWSSVLLVGTVALALRGLDTGRRSGAWARAGT